MPRTFAIGDVHGCADEFEELLNALELEPGDRVIQLGDLVNRGPDSPRAVQLAREYGIECIIGNHERRLLAARAKRKTDALKDYDQLTYKELKQKDWDFLKAMPKYIYDAHLDTVCVHGGFAPHRPWQTQPLETITRIQVIDSKGRPAKRSDAPDGSPWADSWKGPPFVVYGHTPRPNVLDRPGSLGIDTGCVYGGHLTALELTTRALVQVRARQAYAHSKRLPDPI